MAVFPELMNKVDKTDSENAIAVLEKYINYMVEHIEFSISQLNKITKDLDERLKRLE